MSPDDVNALIDDLLILQEREDEINPHPEELHRTAEKAARLIEEWAMRLDWQQRDLERMRLLTREHGEPVSSPWANSRIHGTEELLQKVQQLERENAEQSVLLGKGGERECALLGKVERLERENAALLKDVYLCPPTSENDYEGLKWSDAFDELERENAELREDKESLAKAAQEVLDDYVLHLKVDTGHPCPENMVLCCTLRTAIDAARKEGQL